MRRVWSGVTITAFLAVSCTVQQPSSATPTADDTSGQTEVADGTVEPTLIVEGASAPKRISFQSADGTTLVGTFWPATQSQAPGVLLMHWNPGSREDWTMLSALLQGAGVAGPAPDRPSYAVFAFDFRGHGESGGTANRSGYLEDAQAAFALFQTLPNVDPDRIVLIGASIGGDAAVDVCGIGCIGAISISPGDFLGVSYVNALGSLGDKPVLCVAARDDHPSPETCESGQNAGLTDFQLQLYAGSAHGMDLFGITEEEPALIDLIFDWLDRHVAVES